MNAGDATLTEPATAPTGPAGGPSAAVPGRPVKIRHAGRAHGFTPKPMWRPPRCSAATSPRPPVRSRPGTTSGAMKACCPPHPAEAAVAGNGHAVPAGDGIACLDVLAAQMHARGWSAYVTTPAGRLASLFVQDPHDRPECGDIIAALDATTGHWWYWFSWAERIAPAHAPAAAADVIIRAFQRPADDPP
jgi:hypothetical protein